MYGRLVLNGAIEIRGSLGEICATHVSLATTILCCGPWSRWSHAVPSI